MKTILKLSLVSLISSGFTIMLFISFYNTKSIEYESSPIIPVTFSANVGNTSELHQISLLQLIIVLVL